MTSLNAFDSWAANRSAARIGDWLREISEPDWSATVNHPIFDAIADGSLPHETFAAYLVQDYGFIDPFTALIGHAIGHAPTMEDRVVLGQFMGMLTSDENTFFQRAFEEFGVPEETRVAPAYLDATEDFRRLLRETGRSGSYGEMLAVLTVTEWVYLGWATRVTRAEGLHPLYAEWIALHDNPEFQTFVDWLRRRLHEEGEALSGEAFLRMAARFREAVTLERRFHDAVYPA